MMPKDFTTGYLPLRRELAARVTPRSSTGPRSLSSTKSCGTAAHGFAVRASLPSGREGRGGLSSWVRGARARLPKRLRRPRVVEKCDTATSDVYYTGELLSDAFDNTTHVWTNGSGI